VPYVNTQAAEKLFAHKVILFLKNKGLVSEERIEILCSFRRSGFSVDTSVTLWPDDKTGLERLAYYLLRCPVSLSRIHWTPGTKTLFYETQGSHDDPLASHPKGVTLDIFDFIARVLTQVPEPRKHNIHYFGFYSSKARAQRNEAKLGFRLPSKRDTSPGIQEPTPSSKQRAALRKRWAQLVRRVYSTDPLHCDCGGRFRVLAFITDPKVIRKILDHLNSRPPSTRAPPKAPFQPALVFN
jgi:hypothetical protein